MVRQETYRASSRRAAWRKPSTLTTSTSPSSNGMDREEEEYAGDELIEATEPVSGNVREEPVEDLLKATLVGLNGPRID